MSKKTIIAGGQSSSCIVVTGCSNKSFLEGGKWVLWQILKTHMELFVKKNRCLETGTRI